jgi:transposase-like protein
VIKRGWRRQTEIADEFGEPLPDLIASLRREGNNWEAVAGIIGISVYTLYRWVRDFGVSDNQRVYNNFNRYNLIEHRVKRLGYPDLSTMAAEYRATGKMLKELAQDLECNPRTLHRRLPDDIRGEWTSDPSQKKNNPAGGWRGKAASKKWSLDRYGTERTNLDGVG